MRKVINWLTNSKERPSRDIVAAESPAVRNLWLSWDQLVLHGGILYKKWESVDKAQSALKLVVPKVLQKTVLKMSHDTALGGHLGVRKTYSKLQKKFHWYRMKESVRDWVMKCSICGAIKRPRKKPRAELEDCRVGAVLDHVDSDICGPFPETERGNKYVVTFQDKFSKWVEGYAIPDATAQTVAQKFVYEFCSRLGTPFELHTDQGRNYESSLFQEICKLLEVHKLRSSPFHPSANGMIEKFNDVLTDMIAAFVDKDQRNWDVHLPLLTAAYRCCAHDRTGLSPNKMMLGREVNLPIQVALGANPPADHECYCEYVEELRETMMAVHALAREHLQKNTERQKRDYDTRACTTIYKIGDLVYYVDETKTIGKSPKLQQKWIGPCVVVRKLSDLVYELKPGPKAKCKRRHHDKLKPYLSDQIPGWVQQTQQKLSTAALPEVNTQGKADTPAGPAPKPKPVSECKEVTGSADVNKPTPDTAPPDLASNKRRSPRAKGQPQRYGNPIPH